MTSFLSKKSAFKFEFVSPSLLNVVFSCSFFFTIAVYAEQDSVCPKFNFNRPLFATKLEEFRKSPELLSINPREKDIPELDSHAEIPEFLVEDFSILSKYLFGNKEQVFLKPCLECGDFRAVYQVKTVFFEPKALTTYKNKFPDEWRQVIRFIIAHELSHFVHEKITLLDPKGLSPQGNYTLIRESPFNNFQELLKKEGPNGIFRMVIRTSKSHLEVDGLALTVLLNLGFNDVVPAYKWLKDNSDKSFSFFRIDTYRRAEGIRSSFISRELNTQSKCTDLSEDAEFNYWVNLPG